MIPSTAPLRLLVVDDDAVDRLTVRRALTRSRLTFELSEADCVTSACALLDARPFDAVILDFCLPGGDGFDVLDHLGGRLASTPVIALTGHGDEVLAVTLMKRGAADYLPKSQVTAARLAKSLRDALRVRDLEARERDARDAVARYATQLAALTESSVRLHAVNTVDAALDAIVSEARALFDVAAAVVETADGGGARQRVACGEDDVAPDAPSLCAPLAPQREADPGSITLRGPRRGAFDDTDALILAQYARVAGVGLENARLLRDARSAAQTRDEVLAVVSHDLRSPLGTVTLGVAHLRATLSRRGDEMRAELTTVGRIERGCRQIQRLLGDLLDVSRVDAGTFRVEPRRVRAADVLHDAAESARVLAEAVEVSVRIDLDAPETELYADRERLLQALGNLVGNALKVTPAGGVVTLSTRAEENGARVTVRDTGPGISAEHLPHLFDRYWQGPEGARGATGLGLFIVRAIAEAHGGRVEVESELGRGSAFSLILPQGR